MTAPCDSLRKKVMERSGPSPGCETTSRDDGKTSRLEQLHSRRVRKTIIRHQRYGLEGSSSTGSRTYTVVDIVDEPEVASYNHAIMTAVQNRSRHDIYRNPRGTTRHCRAFRHLSALSAEKYREYRRVL